MATFKCKICGGNIEVGETTTFATCEYCGITSTLPKVNDDRQVNLFNRANNLRRQNDFDKAAAAYENILSLGDSSAEAHWGMVLSRYGIEYVEDPVTKERIPTCHRVQSEPILKDMDYLAALKNAEDSYTKSLYQDEAKRIAEIQKGILKISSKEKPYDVFICYKETANDGGRTKDSALAQDLYYALEKEGHRVFFSRISLESKLGQQYEPYIFNALNSAKVMLVVGTKPEHFNAVWVKNEWSRFLMVMKKDSSRLLIPCYRDMDAYDLPEEMAMLQSQDMGRIGFVQDILHGIKKVVRDTKAETSPGVKSSATVPSVTNGMEPQMKRGWLALEDSDWKKANEYFDNALNIDAEYAPAYMGMLCAELQVKNEEDLANHKEPLDNMPNYNKALRFADPDSRTKMIEYNQAINKRIAEEQRLEQESLRKEEERIAEKKQALRKRRQELEKYNDCISTCSHSVGLKTDGSVIANGKFDEFNIDHGQCNVGSWRNCIAISAGNGHTVGLKANGTVVAVGENTFGQCNVSDWNGVVAIFAGNNHTVGLKADGTVVAVGINRAGQCNVSDWNGVVAISVGDFHTVGLKADGTVVAVGNNNKGLCNVSNWSDIVGVSAGAFHTVGLKADGTVVAVGENMFGHQCNVSDWGGVIAIFASVINTVGLKADGTVTAVGNTISGEFNVNDWCDIGPVDKERLLAQVRRQEQQQAEQEQLERERRAKQEALEQERRIKEKERRIEQSKRWEQQGLCSKCGGQVGGLFSKKCKSCGKPAI